jgi:hypothetical protein
VLRVFLNHPLTVMKGVGAVPSTRKRRNARAAYGAVEDGGTGATAGIAALRGTIDLVPWFA